LLSEHGLYSITSKNFVILTKYFKKTQPPTGGPRRKDYAKEIHEKCFAIPLRLSGFA
jgi:hypothetical protein